jgi:hypothetical protein
LRRMRDRPCRLGQLPAFIQRPVKRSMPTSRFGARRGRMRAAIMIKSWCEQHRITSTRGVASFDADPGSRLAVWAARGRLRVDGG